MSEDTLNLDNFDLEKFQKEVEYELSRNFHYLNDYQPSLVVPPPKPRFPGYSPQILLAIAIGIALGALLTTSAFLINSLMLVGVVALIIVLFAQASYQLWNSKKRQEQRWQRQKEEDAKKRIAELQAKDLLQRQDVRQALCPALYSVTNNVFELVKAVTPTMVTLSYTGNLVVPLTPVLVAAVVVTIAQVGVHSFCSKFLKR